MNSRKTINMGSYPRRAHFDYFRSLQGPYVGLTANVDVTALVTFCKAHGYSFYLSFLHAAALAADSVPAFRQRILDGGIVEYARCDTSHTELLDDGTYCYCTLTHDPAQRLAGYLAYAEQTRLQCRKNASIDEDEDVLGQYFISTLPWLHYTELRQPTAGGDESNPRISWGKFEEDWRGRQMMPVTVLAHHALVDGVHIAAFYENLNRTVSELTMDH